MRMCRVMPWLVCIAAPLASAVAQETGGGIRGRVIDAQGLLTPGATATATNRLTAVTRSAVSGTDGTYRLEDLSPGRYRVVVELPGFRSSSIDDVIVVLGRTVDVDVTLQPGDVSEVVEVAGDARKPIDIRSSTISHNVTGEELDLLPKARSFVAIAATSPSVNLGQIEGGIQVNGASSAENTYTIDGVVTTSLLNGVSRQDTIFEYLQEVQVKTGGINAEYGGALGGVVSAVTRSGGNRLQGELHYYVTGSPLSTGPVRRLVLSPSDETTVSFVQDDRQHDVAHEPGGSIGGPIVKDRLFFFASYSPRLIARTSHYGFSNGADPGSMGQSQTATQAFGKLTVTASRIQANGSVLYTPTRSTGTLVPYDDTTPNSVSSSRAGLAANIDRGWRQDQTNVAGAVDLWLARSAFLSVRGGYFHDRFADTGIPTTTSVRWSRSSVGVPGVPQSLQLPSGTQNTPRSRITAFDTTGRGFVQIDFNQAFSAAGTHLLKGGAGYQRTTNDVSSVFPGGYVLLNWGATFPSPVTGETATGIYGYYEVNDRGTLGKAGAGITSLFVQDAWSVSDRLTLNLGLRSESETIPSFLPHVQDVAFDFGFAEKLAPRLGASYDVRGDGRLKVYGSWGRYYDWTKYGLPRAAFGGERWHSFYRSLDTLDVYTLSLANMPGRDLWGSATGFRDRASPTFDAVARDIKAMYQDSLHAGVEWQVKPMSVLGVHVVHNALGRTIEDLGAVVNGDSVYAIANPGEGLMTIARPSGLTAPFRMPKAIRRYDAVDVTVNRRFSNRWFATASLTVSRLYGNYAGLASSDEIVTPTTGGAFPTSQQQSGTLARTGSNVNGGWDIDEILWDSKGHLDVLGRLATDRPVVARIYGAYSFRFGTQIGALFNGSSGTPMSTYVNTLNGYQVFVNGRGDMGRSPVLTRTDLLVSHTLTARKTQRIRLELNFINLFNQKTATHIFNTLNRGAGGIAAARPSSAIDLSNVDLAKGYDYRALIRRSPDGANAFDPRYGKPDLFQAGLQGQFSIKFIF
jgi:Carboxypeptidase regulatory-like domain